ncbi:MAG: winged helix-turn-helix domain-containing tetratricopeptide repeat protein [Acidobacteriota bacterium]
MLFLGPATLDVQAQVITIGARQVVLQRKPYLVLLYLVEHRDRLVTRRELLDRFWEGKEVYDQSLSKAVGSIRRALGDAEGETFIETRWGLGYRYVGPFAESSSLSALPPYRQSPPEARPETVPAPDPRPPAEAILPGHPMAERLPWSSRRAVPLLAVATLVVAAVIASHYWRTRKVDAATASVRSLAVLPFTAGADDLEGQYVGLEMADTLTARLSAIPQLSVRPSATVRSVVGLQSDPATAARKLAVQAVIAGQIRRTTNGLVISVQMLDPSRGTTRWSGVFDSGSRDTWGVEDEIAQNVSRVLVPQSAVALLRPSPGPGTSNPDAYSDYLKARFFAIARTRNSLSKAVEFLKQATSADPNYARAWAALAECYSLEGFYQYLAPAVAYPLGKAAAEKALALNPSLLDAHVTLLSILTDYEWDWAGAEREFRAAISIDPRSAVAYQYYGYTLLGMGRGDEALVAMQQAERIDPVSPSIGTSLAWGYYLLRRNQQAIAQCKRVLELYPNYVPAHQLMGLTEDQMGLHSAALAELRRAAELEGSNAMTPLYIDYELARSGQRARASRDLATISGHSGRSFVPDYFVAAAWLAAGDRNEAEVFLEQAFRNRSNWMVGLRYDPRFDPIRGDPKFKTLLARLAEHGESPPTALAMN